MVFLGFGMGIVLWGEELRLQLPSLAIDEMPNHRGIWVDNYHLAFNFIEDYLLQIDECIRFLVPSS